MKMLTQAKSRLAALLTPDERRSLALAMLHGVLTTILSDGRLAGQDQQLDPTVSTTQAALISKVWVVSADPLVLELAANQGAQPIFDTTAELNEALELARATVQRAGATALLVIPADVPLLNRADLQALAQALHAGNDVVIAPDHERNGTNALGMRLPTGMPFQFGLHSFDLHCESARRLGLSIHIYTSPTLALDIDTADNLVHYNVVRDA